MHERNQASISWDMHVGSVVCWTFYISQIQHATCPMFLSILMPVELESRHLLLPDKNAAQCTKHSKTGGISGHCAYPETEIILQSLPEKSNYISKKMLQGFLRCYISFKFSMCHLIREAKWSCNKIPSSRFKIEFASSQENIQILFNTNVI